MGAVQTKEGTDIVQELEDMDVPSVVDINQAIIGTSHNCKDSSHLQCINVPESTGKCIQQAGC